MPRRNPSSSSGSLRSIHENPAVRSVCIKPFNYKHEALMKFQPVHPRIAAIGAGGAGKTSIALEILLEGYCCWDIVYLVASNLDEKLYQALIRNPKAFHVKQVIATESVKEWDELYKEADSKSRKLVIFDNLLTQGKLPESIPEVFLQGRHKNWSACIISQTWFQIDKRLRSCLDIIILKRLNSERDASAILQSFGLPSSAVKLYRECTAQQKDSFIIDLVSPASLRYRKNFEPIQLE